jgi:NAD(P)-dependent dehydrogenase (short-subunit alcohol dehydrogenase family)
MNHYSPFSLANKKIIITGASSGIGRRSAIECSKMGAKLCLVARRENELKKTLDLLHGEGHQIAPCDLQACENLQGWIAELADKQGPFDGLLHSAGVSLAMPIKSTSRKMYQDVMGINLDSSYWLIQAFRQKKVRTHRSSIVLLGSVSGNVGTAGLSVYCASKAALLGLAKAAALELVRDGVRVNIISAALVNTELAENYSHSIPESNKSAINLMHPLGVGEPEDIAYAAIYLLSDASKWVTGSNLVVDGGYTAQ